MPTFKEITDAVAAYEAFGQKFHLLVQKLIDGNFSGAKWEEFKPDSVRRELQFLGKHIYISYQIRRVDGQYIGVVYATHQLPGWLKWSEPVQVCSIDTLDNVYLDEPFRSGITPREPQELERIFVRLVSPYVPGNYDPAEFQPKAG